ncbi:hypothetical protein [Teredinibacter haidensis]|uniref:hypothetical protein n=1 Tax=Teredinibacter haidensis TaxID=2731755 RepID=UPI0009490943|nr:hypothetical protein [Teredinibacter haidensis]
MKQLIALVMILSLSAFSTAELQLEKLIKDDWIEVRSKNFTVITDANEKIAKLLVKDLEHFRYFITQTLGKELISGKSLKIIAISSRKNFKRLDLPEFWAGVFLTGIDGDIAVANISGYSKSAKNKSWGNQVLMHEYVHFAARSLENSTYYPMWYNEGVAEYLASFRQEENGKYVSIGNMDVIGDRLYSILKRSGNGIESVDVEDLFKTTNIRMGWRRDESGKKKRKDERAAGKFYARAMLTYHYLKSDQTLSENLTTYLHYINLGKSVDEAFKRSFNSSYKEMDNAIISYVTKNVKYIRFNTEIAGINFPKINPTLTTLSPAQIYEELIAAILRFSSYTYTERDSALLLSNIYAPNSSRVKLSEISYLRKPNQKSITISDKELKKLNKKSRKKLSGFRRLLTPLTANEAEKQYSTLLEKNPDNADILASQAHNQLDNTIRQLKVGHPDGKKNFAKLRTLARKSLKNDGNNALAYYVLGAATARIDETQERFLAEAAMALSNAKFLYGIDTMDHRLWNEIEINMLLGDSPNVLTLSRQYLTRHNGNWINKGYGRFFIEAHETRANPFAKISSSNPDQIIYEDGTVYVGETKNKLPHGKGTLTTYFSSTMSGAWVNGFMEGRGELKTSNGYQYIGQFKEGQVTGLGKIIYPEGKKIIYSEGQFLMGMEHGDHRFVYTDGRIFDGPNWIGSSHGKITVYKNRQQLYSFDAYRGSIRSVIDDNLVFAGRITENYEATGWGTCYSKQDNRVWQCLFDEGKLADNTVTIHGVPVDIVN